MPPKRKTSGGYLARPYSATEEPRSLTELRSTFAQCNELAKNASKEYMHVELEGKYQSKYMAAAVDMTFQSRGLMLKFNSVRMYFIREAWSGSKWTVLAVQVADAMVGRNWSWLGDPEGWTDIISSALWRDITNKNDRHNATREDTWYADAYNKMSAQESNTTLVERYRDMDMLHGVLLVTTFINAAMLLSQKQREKSPLEKGWEITDALLELINTIKWMPEAKYGINSASARTGMKNEVKKEAFILMRNMVSSQQQPQTEKPNGRRPIAAYDYNQVSNNSSGLRFRMPKKLTSLEEGLGAAPSRGYAPGAASRRSYSPSKNFMIANRRNHIGMYLGK